MRRPLRWYPSVDPRAPVLVLLHGSSWHSLQFEALGKALAAAGVAHVAAPDLRGHGFTPVKRGDIGHLGQYEEDIADLIDEVRRRAPGRAVLVGGHSSGGGLAVRFAAGKYGAMADGFVLMAPFLNHAAPTTRPNSGGWARPMVRRIIGLTMLNMARVRALNGLTVIQFAVPAVVRDGPLGATATTHYSYRLNTSYAPRSDYKADIAALTRPFLLLAGREDEAFVADAYEPLMAPLTRRGTYELVSGVGHLGIVDAPETVAALTAFLARFRAAD
jgi:alpha-beta hydrolase superfamily lysophospholipase